MFGFWKKTPSVYDEPIEKVLIEMREQDVDSTEYAAAIGHLETLEKLKTQKGFRWPSADTMAVAGANLLGVLIIVAYEQKHPWTSKAKDHIIKPKTP